MSTETNAAPTTRIIFMGTPDFAASSLKALLANAQAQNWEIAAVVTQPDRRAGRGKKMVASPVKQLVKVYDIPVLQPAGYRKHPDAVTAIREQAPDLIVVAAYGVILPKSVLEIPTYGCVNVHASILPAYRGASPITAALLDGVDETGVTIMLMDEGMDTGPSLSQVCEPIADDDTTETLSQKLARVGADELVRVLPEWLAGEIAPVQQDSLTGQVSYCGIIKKRGGLIDWTQSADVIERMTRAYSPWPSAYTTWRGQPLKIWQASVDHGSSQPGMVVETELGPAVGTGEGLLLLEEIQPAGKKRMDARSFLNGAPEFIGSILGEASDDAEPVDAG